MSRRHRRRDDRLRIPDAAALGPAERVEAWPDGEWVVRPMSGAASTKSYRCPGCDQEIRPAIPHLVAWPLADTVDQCLGERRHWHTACWNRRDRRAPTARRR